ncbi:glucagon peptide 1 receptor, partial [Biomphalaria glabrata]
KLAKFILVLIPLFGIMYLVFYVAVPSNFEETQYNLAYLYLEMGYNSFQGLLLALLFCFLNEEVHIELKRAWLRHKNRRMEMSIINRSFNNFHSSHRKTMSCNSREDDSKIGICPTSGPKGKELYRLRTFSVSSENNELTRVTTSNSFKCPHRVCAQFDDSSLTRYGNINPVFPQSTCGPRTNSLTGKLVTTKFVNPESIHQKTLNEPNNFRSQDLNQESSKTHLLTQEDKEEQEKD